MFLLSLVITESKRRNAELYLFPQRRMLPRLPPPGSQLLGSSHKASLLLAPSRASAPADKPQLR